MVAQHAHSTSLPAVRSRQLGAGVRLSEILDIGTRLEATSFAPDARAEIAELKDAGVELLPLFGEGGLSNEAHNAFRFKRIYVSPERGIPFLTSADIINLRPRMERFLSRRKTPNLSELFIKQWDVLISCSGTIGNVSLAGKSIEGMALSQDAIRWRAVTPELAGYVAAVLRSRFGRVQLRRVTYGSVISHIEPEHLTHILIPILHPIRRSEIGSAMCEAANLRDRAVDLLNHSRQLLIELLELPSVEQLARTDVPVPYTIVRASDLQGRFDGGFHSPVAHRLLEEIARRRISVAALGNEDVTAEIRPITKFRKRTYVRAGGIPLLSSKQFFQVDPIDVKRLAKGAHQKDLDEIALEEDMILVTRSGTIGRVQIVPKYMDGWAGSEHAIRVIAANAVNAGFLFTWLDSPYGYELITRHTYGSVVPEIDKDMLSSVPVPIISPQQQQEIGEPVLEAKRLWHDAWQLERDAIGAIEGLLTA